MSEPRPQDFESVGEFWRYYVPAYKSGSYRPMFARFPYDGVPVAAKRIRRISDRRSVNRINNYVDGEELLRSKSKLAKGEVSIRFGVKKPGHGYSKERGDFCLVSAVYHGKTLTLFYRSIELLGGFAYDLVLIEHVCKVLGVTPKFVELWAVKAFKFALKGNSNEKLYPKLVEIFNG